MRRAALVHNRECSFKGFKQMKFHFRESGLLTKSTKKLPAEYDWGSLIEDWRVRLEDVAHEFVGVAPLSYGIQVSSSANLIEQVFAIRDKRFCRVYESQIPALNVDAF